MLDQRDFLIRPRPGVFNRKIVAVQPQEMPHRLEGRSLISLLEGMSSRDTRHQDHREHDDIFLAEAEEVPRPSQGALQQASIAKKVRLSGLTCLKAIVLDYGLYWQPSRLIRQGWLGSWGT